MRYSKKLLVATIFGLLASSSASFAATQGTEGTTSQGTAEVDVTIPKLVKITGLTDVAQTFNGTTAYDQSIAPVIFSNMAASGRYTVNVNNANDYAAGTQSVTFHVGNDTNAQQIAFTAKWNDVAGTTGEVALTEATNLTTQSGFTNVPGSTTANANLRIEMTVANMLLVLPGTYGATLTILITPE